VPHDATLYLAGPRSARSPDGKLVDQFDSDLTAPGLDFRVFATPLVGVLHVGRNVLAMEVVRGKGGSKSTNVASTSRLPTARSSSRRSCPPRLGSTNSPALLLSDTAWKANAGRHRRLAESRLRRLRVARGREPRPIETDINLRQWNTDAGMYNWPGYEGVSPFLRQTPLAAVAVTHVFSGRSTIANADALTSRAPRHSPSAWRRPRCRSRRRPALYWTSAARRWAGYRSSRPRPRPQRRHRIWRVGERASGPSVSGHDLLTLPANATAYGPKSAFRYARVRFLSAPGRFRLGSIQLDAIFYPVCLQRQLRILRPAAQPNMGDRRLHCAPLHAGRYLGRAQARPRTLGWAIWTSPAASSTMSSPTAS